jgi:PhoH-like ATPase
MPLPPAPSKRAALLSSESFRLRADVEDIGVLPVPQVDDAPEPIPAPQKTASKPQSRKSPREEHPSARAEQPAPRPAEPASSSSPHVARGVPAGSKKVTEEPAKSRITKREPSRKRSGPPGGPARLFVLDTNVLLHDPMSLFRFEEHDIFLPMIVLEELDGHKKGMTEVARNGRQTSRTLDGLVAQQGGDMTKGLKLSATGHLGARGLLFFQT